MDKGLIMEKGRRHLIVMTRDGRFARVPRRRLDSQVGDEIEFSTPTVRPVRTIAATVAAAAVLMLAVLLNQWGPGNGSGTMAVAAYVTMDINPSVEFGVNAEEEVIHAEGLNEEGRQLLEQVEVLGRPLDEAAAAVVRIADEQNYFASGEGSVVIASTVVNPEVTINEQALKSKVKASVAKAIRERHEEEEAERIEVAAVSAPKEVREQAEAKGVSTGKLAIKLLAEEQGVEVDTEQLREQSVHEIAKAVGGIGKLIRNDNEVTEDKLKKLLDKAEEKEAKEREKAAKDEEKKEEKAAKEEEKVNKERGKEERKTEKGQPNHEGNDDRGNDGSPLDQLTGGLPDVVENILSVDRDEERGNRNSGDDPHSGDGPGNGKGKDNGNSGEDREKDRGKDKDPDDDQDDGKDKDDGKFGENRGPGNDKNDRGSDGNEGNRNDKDDGDSDEDRESGRDGDSDEDGDKGNDKNDKASDGNPGNGNNQEDQNTDDDGEKEDGPGSAAIDAADLVPFSLSAPDTPDEHSGPLNPDADEPDKDELEPEQDKEKEDDDRKKDIDKGKKK